ncbi:MAG: ATP-binding protein [Candidatus Jordarchaeales archaeon]
MLERGRPVCELLHTILGKVDVLSLSGGEGTCALAAVYQLTGRREFLERAVAEADKLAGMILEGGSAGGRLNAAARALRLARGGRTEEALGRLADYAFRTTYVDVALLQVLLEVYWATGRGELLSKMREAVDRLSGVERARGVLALYGATGERRFFDEAAGVLGEDAALACWEVCNFDPNFYPEGVRDREKVFESLSLDNAEDVWRALSALLGELRARRRDAPGDVFDVGAPLEVMLDEVGEGVVLGRTREEREVSRGLAYIGRVWERGELAGRPVLLDVLKPHVVFICGQRGSGKSYTLGVLAEEIARSGLGVAVVIVDPIGVFWSMKQPSSEADELRRVREWGLEPKGFSNVRVFVPLGVYGELPETTRDVPFSVKPSDLTVDDWCYAFGVERFSPPGLLIEKALVQVREGYAAFIEGREVKVEGKGDEYSVDDLIECIETSKEILSRERGFKPDTRRAVVSRLLAAKGWGIFSKEGTPLEEIVKPNTVSVVDVSTLTGELRGLVVGLLARKILERRKREARAEEAGRKGAGGIPVTWLMVDEAHTLIPAKGETAASKPLVEYATLGRKPGCALVLATQQPSATDDRVLSQVDVVIAHRLVFEADVEAFRRRSPNVVPKLAEDLIRRLPTGVAVVSDVSAETGRAFVVKVRPRVSKHAGREATPSTAAEGVGGEAAEGAAKPSEVSETKAVDIFRGVEGGEAARPPEATIEPTVGVRVLDVPQDLALDYLSRLVKYRFHEHLYPSQKAESSGFQLAVKVNPSLVVGKLKEVLASQGWEVSEQPGEEVVVLAGRGAARLAAAVGLSVDATLVAVEVTAPSREEAARLKGALEKELKEVKGEWVPPPRRERRRVVAPPVAPIETAAEAPPAKREAEDVEGGVGRGGDEEVPSREEVAAKIQRIRKYLQSLHEYYSLGRMSEEEYTFLMRKALRKIRELEQMLSRMP